MSPLATTDVKLATDRDVGPRAFASCEGLTAEELLAAPVRWLRPSRLEDPLDVKPGKLADGLKTLGLTSVGALLEHLPRDSRDARTVGGLREGEGATVAVQVRTIGARPVRRRRDEAAGRRRPCSTRRGACARRSSTSRGWRSDTSPGRGWCSTAGRRARGTFNVAHHALGSDLDADLGDHGTDEAQMPGEIAHYPAAEGVSSTQILTLVQGVRGALQDVPEALSAAVRVSEGLPDRAGALAAMHYARTPRERETGRERLAFEELLLAQLVFLRRRARRHARRDAPTLAQAPSLSERWLKNELPFALTGDQRRAIEAIGEDLARERAMQRLLLGEVGSGKTVVAVWALLRAVEHGMQAALMAPTETLAEQHFATLQTLLGGEQANVTCALLTGSTSARRRADTLGKLAGGELSLVVGTHALIEPDVEFAALAVAVVDEQHRFGVRQRAALDSKAPDGATPHVLHMTATPIPRTLALATLRRPGHDDAARAAQGQAADRHAHRLRRVRARARV